MKMYFYLLCSGLLFHSHITTAMSSNGASKVKHKEETFKFLMLDDAKRLSLANAKQKINELMSSPYRDDETSAAVLQGVIGSDKPALLEFLLPLLKEAKFDLNKKSIVDQTPLEYAEGSAAMQNLLFAAGAKYGKNAKGKW